jgi:hypothetical protein
MTNATDVIALSAYFAYANVILIITPPLLRGRPGRSKGRRVPSQYYGNFVAIMWWPRLSGPTTAAAAT